MECYVIFVEPSVEQVVNDHGLAGFEWNVGQLLRTFMNGTKNESKT